MEAMHLYMVLVGCRPPGRNTEQHDVYFGIGQNVKDLLPGLYEFWPAAKKNLHLDAWRQVQIVDGYQVLLTLKDAPLPVEARNAKLFFINLGGYKKDEFEEFHYKMVVAATDKGMAINKARQTAFYQHTGFKSAPAHVDDKFGIDVDDIFEIKEILPTAMKDKYRIVLMETTTQQQDELHLGYMPPHKL